jgi:hypothetical protein
MVNVNNIASKLQATLDRQIGKSHIYNTDLVRLASK